MIREAFCVTKVACFSVARQVKIYFTKLSRNISAFGRSKLISCARLTAKIELSWVEITRACSTRLFLIEIRTESFTIKEIQLRTRSTGEFFVYKFYLYMHVEESFESTGNNSKILVYMRKIINIFRIFTNIKIMKHY